MGRCMVCLVSWIVYILVLCLLNATALSSSHRSKARQTGHPEQNENEANAGSRGGESDEGNELTEIFAREELPEKLQLEDSQVNEFHFVGEGSKSAAGIKFRSTTVAAGKDQRSTGVDESDLDPGGSSRVLLKIWNDHVNLGKARRRLRKPRDVRTRQGRRHTSGRRQASAGLSSKNYSQPVLVNTLPQSASQIGPMLQPGTSSGSANLTDLKHGGPALPPGQPVSAHFSSFSIFSSATSSLSKDKRQGRRRQKASSDPVPKSRPMTTPPSLQAIRFPSDHHYHHQFLLQRADQRGPNATEDRSGNTASVLGDSRTGRLTHDAVSTQESHQREATLHLREEPGQKADGPQAMLEDCRRCDLDMRMLTATYQKNLETLKLVLMEAMDRFILDPSQLLTSALCDVLNIPTARHHRRASQTSGRDSPRSEHGVSRHSHHRTSLHGDENSRSDVGSPAPSRHQTDRDTPDHAQTTRPSQNERISGHSGTSGRSAGTSVGRIEKDRDVFARDPTGDNTRSPYLRENAQRIRHERIRQHGGGFDINAQDNDMRKSNSHSNLRVDHENEEHLRVSVDISSADNTPEKPLPWHAESEPAHDHITDSKRTTGNKPGGNLLVNGVGGEGERRVNGNQLSTSVAGASEQRSAGGSLSILQGSRSSPHVLDVQETGDTFGIVPNQGGLHGVSLSLQQANRTQAPAMQQPSTSSDKVGSERQAQSFNDTLGYRSTQGPRSSPGGSEVVTRHVGRKRTEFPTEDDGSSSQEPSVDEDDNKRIIDEDGGREASSNEDHSIDEKQQKEFWERWRQEQRHEKKLRGDNSESLSCVLGPWTSWAGPVGFGVIERRRSVVGGEEGCMAKEGDLVMRVDISVFSDKNPYYKTPEAVGQDFEADFTRSHEPRDLLIVLDASGSIEAEDFRLMKEGVQLMVDLFCGGFGPNADNNRLAVAVFASDIELAHRFSDDQSPDTLRSAIANMTQPNGNTCTSDALRFAHDVIFAPENGARPDVIHDTLLVTDGHSNCGEVTVQEAADVLHAVSNVFALGVGVANDTAARWELNSVVSNRDPRHIFSLARFQDFKDMLQSIQDRRNLRSCLPIVADNASSEE